MPKISDLTVALKQLPAMTYLYAFLGVAVIGAWQANNYHQREIGKREVQIAYQEHENRRLRMANDSLANQYRVDTLWRRVTKTRVDSLTVTVDRWKHDTLRVVEFVAKADTAARACTQALLTCETRIEIAQRGWSNARAEVALLRASIPSKSRPWVYGAAGVGIGVLAGRLMR